MSHPEHFMPGESRDRLRLLTLNVAHGRKQAANQLLVNKAKIRANLKEISSLIRRSEADVVALQEADGPSRWSGGFDHAEAIAHDAGYAWQAHSRHSRSWLYQYGTSVLSRHPITDSLKHRFAPSPPTLRKGFVVGQVAWRGKSESATARHVDVVSVHLDFFSHRIRQRQIRELHGQLEQRSHPCIVLGDFNDEWMREDSVVRDIADQLDLTTFEPEAEHLATHNNQRLDWILVSPQLEIHDYRVLPESISDHNAVLAEISFRD